MKAKAMTKERNKLKSNFKALIFSQDLVAFIKGMRGRKMEFKFKKVVSKNERKTQFSFHIPPRIALAIIMFLGGVSTAHVIDLLPRLFK